MNGEECLVLRVDGGDDPFRRLDAVVGNERLPAARVESLLRALETVERAVEERIGVRRECDLRKSLPVGMHDELAVRRHDVEVPGLADDRLGDVAEHPGMREAEAAGEDGDHPPVLGEYRHGHDQHHVRVAYIGEERFRDDGFLRTDRILDVRPPRRVVAAPAGLERTLGEQDSLVRKQEDRPVERRVEPAVGVQVFLRLIRRRNVGLRDLDGAEQQCSLQRPQFLIEIVGDALDQGILFRNHDVGQLRPERIHRRHADGQNGEKKQKRSRGRRAGGECRLLQPLKQTSQFLCSVQFSTAQIVCLTPRQAVLPLQEICRTHRNTRSGPRRGPIEIGRTTYPSSRSEGQFLRPDQTGRAMESCRVCLIGATADRRPWPSRQGANCRWATHRGA